MPNIFFCAKNVVFSYQICYNLKCGFMILSTKTVNNLNKKKDNKEKNL